MKKENISRRSFMKKSALGAGAVGFVSPFEKGTENNKLPREVFIAGFCSSGLHAPTSENMIERVLEQVQTVFPLKPDIVCFPEIFPFYWGVEKQVTVPEQAEYSKRVVKIFSVLAQKNNAWIICPVVTSETGNYYNAAVVINRQGKYVGEYRKIHPTDTEMYQGISPGQTDPPVFETDFGKIGIQICFDIQWNDGWEKLQQKGAEIIFWPSAFPGGFLLNARARQHHAFIVSSPLKGEGKICDTTGKDISKSGRYRENWNCSPVNLEREVLHTWPYVKKFDAIQEKYGRKILIRHLHDEEIAVIESRSPDVFIKDVLKEFDINTHTEHIAFADRLQKKARETGLESILK